jgi:hypothetical protein
LHEALFLFASSLKLSEDRTAGAESLLNEVSENGILAMEEAIHAIGEHLRLLQLGEDDLFL